MTEAAVRLYCNNNLSLIESEMTGKKSTLAGIDKPFMTRHKKAAAEGGRSFCLVCGKSVGMSENFAVIYRRGGCAAGVCHEDCAYETQTNAHIRLTSDDKGG